MQITVLSKYDFTNFTGGAEISLDLLVKNLSQNNNIAVITGADNSIPYTEVVKIKSLFNSWLEFIIFAVPKVLTTKSDVFIGMSSQAAALALASLVKPIKYTVQIPSIITPDTNEKIRQIKLNKGSRLSVYKLQVNKYIHHNLEKIAVKRAHSIQVKSKYMADELLSQYPHLSRNKVHVIPNGLTLNPIDKRVRSNGSTLLFVGRLDPRKGIHTLLDSFKLLSKNVPNMKLNIVGEGELNNEIKQWIKENGFNNSIFLKGRRNREQLVLDYLESDIVVIPSDYEPFGNVALEAMAYSKIVIASKIGGLQEIIDDGENGYLFTAGNSNELKDVIEKVLLSAEASKVVAINGHNKVIKEYNWSIVTQKFLSILS